MKAGNGPSKAELILDRGIVRKHFAENDGARLLFEVEKLDMLKRISGQTDLFSVPEVLKLNEHSYDLEYIPNAHELNDAGLGWDTKTLAKRLFEIVDYISKSRESSDDVWQVMLEKFYQLKIEDKEYYDLVDHLPKDIIFKNANGFSHGDMSFDNILYANKKLYLIDPAWSRIESPLWDVGKIMQSCLIGWGQIKEGIIPTHENKIGWLRYLTYSIQNDSLLDMFVEKYGFDGVILATACQLARVSRWCYPEVLVPIVKKLLKLYLQSLEKGYSEHVYLDALRRTL